MSARQDARRAAVAARGGLDAPAARSVEDLGLGVRTTNCLERAGIRTIGQLASLTDRELSRTPNLGRKRLAEIRKALQALGLSLGMGDATPTGTGPAPTALPGSTRDPPE